MDTRIQEMKKLAEEDYLEDVYIDQNNLDNECIVSPVQISKWGNYEVCAKKLRKDLANEFEVKRAEMELLIRSENVEEIDKRCGEENCPESAKFSLKVIGKQTEASVKALLVMCPALLTAQREIDEMDFVVSLFSTARNSFDRKFSSLGDLTKQYTTNYFAKDTKFKSTINRDAIVSDARMKIKQAIELASPKPMVLVNDINPDVNVESVVKGFVDTIKDELPKAPVSRIKR